MGDFNPDEWEVVEQPSASTFNPDEWEVVEQPSAPVVSPVDSGRKYVAPNDLLGSRELRQYMIHMGGAYWETADDQEVLDAGLKRLRRHHAGNSVAVGEEFFRLNRLSDEAAAEVGQMYSIFDQMDSSVGKGGRDTVSMGERVQSFRTYADAMVLDPINFVSLGFGKLAQHIGAGAASSTAKNMAQAAYKRALAKGASEEEAKKQAVKVFERLHAAGVAQETAAINLRTSQRAAGEVFTGPALTDFGVSVGVDTAFAIGLESARQSNLVEAGAQEQFRGQDVGLAALGTMVLGGMSAGLNFGTRGTSGQNPLSTNIYSKQPQAASQTLGQLGTALKEGDWMSKVRGATQLEDLDDEFWKTMLLETPIMV